MAYTLPQLEQALYKAHTAGDTDSARKLAAVIRRERESIAKQSPTTRLMNELDVAEYGEPPVEETIPRAPEPTVGQQVKGAGETGLTIATGATSGFLGQIEGAVEGIVREIAAGEFGSQEAANRIEELAMERAQQFTYAPRTRTGQEMVEAMGEALEPLAAVPPLAEAQIIAQSTRPALQQARQAVAPQVQQLAQDISQQVKARVPSVRPASPSERSAGSAQVEAPTLRQAQADELPVPVKLTEGQRTRDFEAQRFERETAKLPEEGAPIRERFDDQNRQLQQNMDAFIDETGSQLTDLRGVGEVVDQALRNRAAADKTRIRSLYKEAEKAGEMESPVEVQGLSKYLNENRAERAENGIMQKVQRQLDVLEVAEGNFAEGNLQLRPMTLKQAEAVRSFINSNVNNADANDVRIASALKSTIDDATEMAGGSVYKKARAARAKYAKDYENIGLIKNLIGTKKGSSDRAIALEDVVRKAIIDPSTSLDTTRQLRRLLQTKAGEEGKQAWKELQGATLRHIQNEMTKGVTTNQRGDKVVSAAALNRVITRLDESGKLDFVFGKKGAEQLRTVNEVAKMILTAPPGTVNTSNTATVLAGLLDVAVTGTTGVPAPIATSIRLLTSQIKDAKLKARIRRALGDQENVSE